MATIMKGLSIEEKAKRYDEAIEKAKKYHEECKIRGNDWFVEDMEDMFPELKESEDERIIHWIRKELEAKYVVDNIVNNEIADKALAWLEKQGEQKPTDKEMKILLQTEYEKGKADAIEQNSTWGEEDELMLTSIIQTLKLTNGAAQMKIDWLKSLKDRVQPQPKQKWSEDDEDYRHDVNVAVDDYFDEGYAEELRDWLKSLKERYTWKPSKEQMYYLSWIANVKLGDGVVEQEVSKHLNGLYDDLKKLMEK